MAQLMAAQLMAACPFCEHTFRSEIVAGQPLDCPNCQQTIQASCPDFAQTPPTRCLTCPSTELFVRKGGILQVTITERVPAILWRNGAALEMLDATGNRVATLLDRSARPDLPVIAGEGADEHVPEALTLIRTARPILGRLRGLVWMGERRWDLVLDRDQRIMLPEIDPVPALQRVIALDQAEDLLGRDLVAVDMRNEARPTLRLKPAGDGQDEIQAKVDGQ